ncbi:MAG TPA: hypothetical protein EYP90_04750, partial [Chromatiaceae bacterium]|nr:hypothetical protein [Chromatiaceae bacterium]
MINFIREDEIQKEEKSVSYARRRRMFETDSFQEAVDKMPKCGDCWAYSSPECPYWADNLSPETFKLAIPPATPACRTFKPKGGEIIKPIFDSSQLLKPVHPAIGVVDGVAYVGVWLPVRIKNKGESQHEMYHLITSEREYISCTSEKLAEIGWCLSTGPSKIKRWRLEGIKAWLSGEKPNSKEVFNRQLEVWRHYIEFPDKRYYCYVVLWETGTYFYHLFNAYPYVYFGGVKRSGKTKALTLLSLIAFNPVFSTDISGPSLFRLIQTARPTVLIDETEKLANPERAQDIRSLLLSGYKRGGVAYRTEKNRREAFEVNPYEVYSPKALANIKGLDDVLEDRTHTFIMRRALGPQRDRKPDAHPETQPWVEIRDLLYRLYLHCWRDIQEIYEWLGTWEDHAKDFKASQSRIDQETRSYLRKIKDEIKSRDWELWRPILTLAIFFQHHGVQGLVKEIGELAIQEISFKQIENM